MVLALTMIFLVVAVSIAGVLISSGSAGLQQSVNQKEAYQARLAAESGMGYLSALLQRISLSDANDPIADVGLGLSYGIVNGSVYTQGDVINVYPIAIENGSGGMFSAQLSKIGSNYLLTVTGTSGSTSRTVTLEFAAEDVVNNALFKNGFLLGGKLLMTDNATFNGKNDPSEARVFTNYTGSQEVFNLSGNAVLEGDLQAANPGGYATISNNVTIADETDYSEGGAIWDHIDFGAPLVELPRPDPTVFEPYATNILSKKTAGNTVFSNVRIPANTNPKFTGTVEFEGVLYIESPNKLTFLGDVIITGIIVTEDPGPGQIANNYINFGGGVKFQDIATLPESPEYSDLRKMTGAAMLAPGFGVEFTGDFGTVAGALAAEKFIFSGNSGGTVRGPVINYSSDPFEMSSSTHLTIDRKGNDTVPPGFDGEITVLTPILNTYKELRK